MKLVEWYEKRHSMKMSYLPGIRDCVAGNMFLSLDMMMELECAIFFCFCFIKKDITFVWHTARLLKCLKWKDWYKNDKFHDFNISWYTHHHTPARCMIWCIVFTTFISYLFWNDRKFLFVNIFMFFIFFFIFQYNCTSTTHFFLLQHVELYSSLSVLKLLNRIFWFFNKRS